MKMETAVPVLMDKSGIRIGSCRLSQIFILRMCHNINIERRLPGDEGPFSVIPDLLPRGQQRCWLIPGAQEEVTEVGCSNKCTDTHLTKIEEDKLFTSDLRSIIESEREENFSFLKL